MTSVNVENEVILWINKGFLYFQVIFP